MLRQNDQHVLWCTSHQISYRFLFIQNTRTVLNGQWYVAYFYMNEDARNIAIVMTKRTNNKYQIKKTNVYISSSAPTLCACPVHSLIFQTKQIADFNSFLYKYYDLFVFVHRRAVSMLDFLFLSEWIARELMIRSKIEWAVIRISTTSASASPHEWFQFAECINRAKETIL